METSYIARTMLWGALIALLSVGCGQKTATDHSVNTPDRGMPNGGPVPANQGTVDGGGGAGYKGKPLESYRRDIQNLNQFPEFALVNEVLNSIRKVDEKHYKVFLHIVRDRLWLFLNEPIPKISESRQGVPYNIDQWAVQNSKEIWMSDQYQGEKDAKAKILLHEILVGLKIMRFLSYNEYCYQWTENRALCGDNNNEVLVPNYKLTDLDHADVRQMGEWLWQNHSRMNAGEFGYQMHARQFQSPHYTWKPPFSEDLGERTINRTIERLNERKHELFTDWGTNAIARQKCVIQFELDMDKGRVRVHVTTKDLASDKVNRAIDYDVAYDSKSEIKSSLRANNHGRTTSWTAQEGKPMKNVGDKEAFISLEINNLSNVEFFGGERQVTSVENGVPSSNGDDRGPKGLFCDESPVALPVQYNVWLEMRDGDRELLERQRYGGKTVRQLLENLSRKPEYRLAQ